MEDYVKRSHCAICGSSSLNVILDYGMVPLAGYFPSEEEKEKEELFPLNVLFCEQCSLVQTDSIINADKLFRDYRYMSSIGLQKHFDSVAKLLVERFNLSKHTQVIEIGSNDGVLLKPLMDLNIACVGFEPATNISKVAEDRGCYVINDYFNLEKAQEYLEEKSISLFVSNNCFAHIDDIKGIVEGVKHALKPGGHFVIEVSYLKDLIEKLQYDNIYHEHIYYYSLYALKCLFDQFAMTIIHYDLIPIHGGSIRVTVQNSSLPVPERVQKLLDEEVTMGLTNLEWFKTFGKKVNDHREMVKEELLLMKTFAFGKRIVGYGASGRANMLCSACDITPSLVEFIVDESPERAGRFIAGKKIPIVTPEYLHSEDIIVIFAWNFYEMIKKKLSNRNFTFVKFFPEFSVEKD